MTRAKGLTVGGQSFASILDAAKHFGVHPTTAARRIREGWTAEQALGVAPPKALTWGESRLRPLKTSVGEFRTVEEAAAHFGLPQQTLANRLRAGWPPDEAVGLVPYKRKPKAIKLIVCNGVEYPNTDAFADAFGLNRIRVYKRLSRGWTPEQAVGLAPPPPRFRDPEGRERSHMWKQVLQADNRHYPGADVGAFKLYVIRNQINGKEYVGITVSPLAERLRGHRAVARDGTPSKLYKAMRRYGVNNFTIELVRNDARSFAELQDQEIAEIKARDTIRNGYNTTPGGSIGTAEEVTIAGVTYPSRGAAAAHFGIDVAVFNMRLSRLGWTPEQAAEIEPRPAFARRRVEVNGKHFRSLKSAADHFGLDYGTVHARVTRFGWSIQQALGLEAQPTHEPNTGTRLVAFGHEYPSIAACAKAHGVKPMSLRYRLVEKGEDPEAAIAALTQSSCAAGER